MIKHRINHIRTIIGTFTGKDGEPKDDLEFYILKSMWIMMLSEFEGSLKDLVESYIDEVKNMKIKDINVCVLLQPFFPNKENFTMENVIKIYKEDPKKITYLNFTRNKQVRYKSGAVQNLFIGLGVIFSDEEMGEIRMLDSIASTRDSIAHGDQQISITKKEIEQRLLDVEQIFSILKGKLAFTGKTPSTVSAYTGVPGSSGDSI